MFWLRLAATLLLGCAGLVTAAQDANLSPEQSKFLEAVRAASLQYTQDLPNFICTQTTHRTVTDTSSFAGGVTGVSTGGRGIPGLPSGLSSTGDDTIEEQLSFFDRSEHYDVVAVNGRKVSGARHLQFAGVVSAGEFGSALENIFDPRSQTVFAWDRDSSIGGHSVRVLKFRVPKESGNLVIYDRGSQQTIAPYNGRVFVDVTRLQVVRIVSELELPVEFPIKLDRTTVEYKPVEIAGKSFNLPYKSEVRLQDASHLYVNEIEFRKYHKFSAESTLHYDNSMQPQ
ncbi:MAG TPA: hypothetical protein VGF82_01460 [Terracidiphilus sp.]